MRSPRFTTNSPTCVRERALPSAGRKIAAAFLISLFLSASICAQKIAVLTPEKQGQVETFAGELKNSLSKKFVVLEDGLSETAFHSVQAETPFNMTTETAKNAGSAIGCEYLLLVRSGRQRRTSLEKSDYFEATAAIFVVSSRTGRLVFWKLEKHEAAEAKEAEKMLVNSTETIAGEVYTRLKTVAREELNEKTVAFIEEPPAPGSPEAQNFRSPVPYKRIKPEYTTTAYFYNVAATVDAVVDVDAQGNILRLEIARWAGYGLDESVADAVRKMNWRPGTRGGKTLPVRVLLRYNFKKIDKEPIQ